MSTGVYLYLDKILEQLILMNTGGLDPAKYQEEFHSFSGTFQDQYNKNINEDIGGGGFVPRYLDVIENSLDILEPGAFTNRLWNNTTSDVTETIQQPGMGHIHRFGNALTMNICSEIGLEQRTLFKAGKAFEYCRIQYTSRLGTSIQSSNININPNAQLSLHSGNVILGFSQNDEWLVLSNTHPTDRLQIALSITAILED